jgi:AraC family transcriptional regulator
MTTLEHVKVMVDAEVRLPVATAQLARIAMNGPADYIRREPDTYRIDLSFTPRPCNARACYREHWSHHRFERIGSMFVIPPAETVMARSDAVTMQQSSVLCYIQPSPMREWFGGDLEWTDRRLEATLDMQSARIRTLMLRLADELRHPGFASELLIGHIAAEIAIELGRYCTSIQEGPPRGGLAPWRLRLIDERLNDIQALPTLPELARLCNLSVRALTRGFRVSRGISIGEHVAGCRVDHAKRLLTAGESTKSVAFALGFASVPSFCYAFRRAAGETPGEFRLRLHRETLDAEPVE